MKKIIVQILLFVIIFNSIFNSFCGCKAKAATSEFVYDTSDFEQADSEGTATMEATGGIFSVDKANTQSTMAAIIGNFVAVVSLFPMVIIKTINLLVGDFGYVEWTTDLETRWLTIQNIVFGHYYMLDANMFRNSSNASIAKRNGSTIASDNGIDLIKENVAKWYYIMQMLAIAIGLITLIYIGIRMALSTVASDQAKYKKMLIAWVQSIGLIFILPYMMRGLNYINKVLLDFAVVARDAIGGESFEDYIIKNIGDKLNTTGGSELAAYSVAYILLMFAEFKFLMLYIKRFFSVAFLTIIAPLISITYSIDKAGDGRAQAFSAWLEEYMVNMLIQPMQAFIYLIFVFSATEIAKAAPIVGIIFLFTLTRAEKVVRIIFNVKELVSSQSMQLFKKG